LTTKISKIYGFVFPIFTFYTFCKKSFLKIPFLFFFPVAKKAQMGYNISKFSNREDA